MLATQIKLKKTEMRYSAAIYVHGKIEMQSWLWLDGSRTLTQRLG